MNKKYIMAIVAIIAIAGVAGAMFLGNTSVERNPNELVVVAGTHEGEPEAGFDPLQGWCVMSEPLIQSTLFKSTNDNESNMEIVNDLATDYTTSNGGKTWIVNIRDDVKFHDGTKLTAKDVAFSYNEALKTGASVDLSSMNKSTALNDTAIEFTLNNPDSSFIYKLTGVGIVPEASYNNETYGSNPIGSGPYKFVQWDKGQQVILELNQEYYGKKPYFKKLTMLFLDSEGAFAAAKKGEIDLAEIPLSYSNESVNNMSFTLLDTVSTRGISLPYLPDTGEKTENGNPIGNNVTSNEAIRKALSYGIDRQKIIDGPFLGIGNKSYDGISSLLPWSNPEATIEDGDIEEAKRILEEDGWKDTDGDGIVEKDGQNAEFDLVYAADDGQRQAIAVSLSEQAKELGIQINIEGKSWDEIDKIQSSKAVVWSFGADDPSSLMHQYDAKYAGKGYDNPTFYNNSQVNQHMEDALSAADEASATNSWKSVSWDGTTGISPKGDAAWLWIMEDKEGIFVDDSIDMGTLPVIYHGHGLDLFKNIYDWKRV